MAFKKQKDMLTSVLNELALVTGSSVQTYTEPIIVDYIQSSFDHLFKKRFWDHLTLTTFHTLDGVVGVTTDSLINIEDLTDIQWIREIPYEEKNDIPYIREGVFNTDLLCYTGIPYGEDYYDDKRVKFNPVTNTNTIAVRARRRPPEFTADSIVPFDALAMKHLVAASLLATDGMNPSAQERQDIFFNDRYETLVSNEADNKLVSKRGRFDAEFTVAE